MEIVQCRLFQLKVEFVSRRMDMGHGVLVSAIGTLLYNIIPTGMHAFADTWGLVTVNFRLLLLEEEEEERWNRDYEDEVRWFIWYFFHVFWITTVYKYIMLEFGHGLEQVIITLNSTNHHGIYSAADLEKIDVSRSKWSIETEN